MEIKNNPNIFIVSKNSNKTEAPKHAESKINSLNHFYNFFFKYCGSSGAMIDKLKNKINYIEIKQLKSDLNPINDNISLIKLNKLISTIKPQIIYCNSSKVGLISRLNGFIKKTHCIFTFHGWGWRALNKYKSIIVFISEYFLSNRSKYII